MKKVFRYVSLTLLSGALLVLVPLVGELLIGSAMWWYVDSPVKLAEVQRHHDAHLAELREHLPSCAWYMHEHHINPPAGNWHPVNERGDWLCQ